VLLFYQCGKIRVSLRFFCLLSTFRNHLGICVKVYLVDKKRTRVDIKIAFWEPKNSYRIRDLRHGCACLFFLGRGSSKKFQMTFCLINFDF
jgi:hypothetical protein